MPGARTTLFLCVICFFLCVICGYAEEEKPEPIVVNGDKVEYSTDAREVTASGNVEVTYKDAKLTCQKLTLNNQTKVAIAEGNARLDDEKGVIEGARLIYNFQAKTGTVISANFRSNPYFGKANKVEKVSDAQFNAFKGYFTTCNLNKPHYRIKSKQIKVFSQDKIQTKGDTVYLGNVPLLYLSQYNHSLKDPLMHVQFMPGKSKDWGQFLLTGWRYNISEYLNGRIYLDLRQKLGVAEGFGANYSPQNLGRGDLKFYYTQERTKELEQDTPAEFQRYFIRWKHKWDIDEQTNFIAQYYKITDSKRMVLDQNASILKDYFFREYEKDTQPSSFLSFHHSFSYSSMDFFMQKRTNRWYGGYLERLPEITFSLPSIKVGDMPFSFENNTSMGNYNKKNTSTLTPAANANSPDTHVNRLDTTNKLSFPIKASVFNLTPFVSSQQTFYDKDIKGKSIHPRTVFLTGTDLSTKFYRIFDIHSSPLGIEIDRLRHVITPSIGYSYNHEPTIPNNKLRQIDGVDSLAGSSNSASLSLSNKLQTKRKKTSVDLVDFIISSTYTFKPKSGDERGSFLGDILLTLKVLPYSWMTINADTTYKHAGSRTAEGYHRFSNANYDINFDFKNERTIGFGQRYLRKGTNYWTLDIDWRLNPKWKFSFYQSHNIGHDPAFKRGLREQEYGISRDLHCWVVEFLMNQKRDSGESIWLVFRLKAFPELEFEYDQAYHAPKPGSQSNP